jgi:Protein of unknown function (DUF3108)
MSEAVAGVTNRLGQIIHHSWNGLLSLRTWLTKTNFRMSFTPIRGAACAKQRRPSSTRSSLVAALLALTCHLSAEPPWQSQLSPPQPGVWTPLAPSVLEFQISWKGMLNAGNMRMEFAPKDVKKPGALVVRSTSSSLGAASALFPYNGHTWSEIDPTSLKPGFFEATETDRKESTTTTNRYFPDRVESTDVTRSLETGATTRKSHTFAATSIFDVFSSMLQIRSRKLDNGDTITLLIHPFDNPYLLNVKVLGRELHQNRKTIKLSVGMRKIDRKTLQLRPYKKMKKDATLWLSDDADRIPVEFRAAVFIGDVRATLSRFEKLKP